MNNIFFRNACTGLLSLATVASAWAFTPSTQPPQSSAVPGNVMLALSVEFPTGLQVSYTTNDYTATVKYSGYFDNRKCYTYSTTNELFSPSSAMNTNGSCPANTEWSGNLLNWLTMTNLDQFRSVMTGGTRDNFSSMSGTNPGDTTTRTVLIRSFSDRNAYNNVKNIQTNTVGVPASQRTVKRFVRSGGYGSKFIISNANNFSDLASTDVQKDTCANTPKPGNNGTSACFNIRVETCKAVTGVGLDENCTTTYTGVPKPEGLVQQYNNNMRFGAFGYLNESGNDRSGGVLRSAMKSVGPLAATKTGVTTNPNPEWSKTDGTFVANPDPVDAAASGVAESGLINYLNKFGFAAGYKGNDPVSELYYAAQRYMRGYALPIEYTNNLNTAYKDGFPVITGNAHTRGGSRDPIMNTCQKNFMLTIGDIYVHCDGNLPGSNKAWCAGGTPADPDNLDVQSLWNTTRGLENNMPDARDSTGVNGWAGGAGNPTPYVAGLAYWGNTQDIRSDLAGKQTISTYFVDVLENGNGVGGMPAAGLLRSQYWLAAKYGGFDTTVAGGNNPNITPASWDENGDGVPDTWFAGSTPELLRAGLSSAFADIAAKSGANSASSAAVTSQRQTSDSKAIYAGYNPQNWSGTLRSCLTTQTAAECRDSPVWEASTWFKTTTPTLHPNPLTATNRKIFTSWQTGSTFTSMPFQWTSGINTAQKAKLTINNQLGEERLNYLRGDRTNEGIYFRKRHDKLLGDIVNSGVTYVAGTASAYFGSNFSGNAAYRTSTKNRPAVVYVGSNDGMLHAFSGTDGKELFGYIPSSVYDNITDATSTSKLAESANLNFQHQFMVDSTPMAGDFQKTGSTWGTMLVGGLGAGGKGYYALDITNQKNFASMSESQLAAIPMWEFTYEQDHDLGYTFNEPSVDSVSGEYKQIAKVADATTATGVWRVIVGNGFGAASGDAYLYMLDAKTGATGSIKLLADNGTKNGLATPTPVDSDNDGLVDTVYAGDILGNMHKFQFSKSVSGNYVVAKPTDSGAAWRYIGKLFSAGEAITTAPAVSRSAGGGWYVSFGTGKLMEDADYTDTTSPAGFYSLLDEAPSSSLTIAGNEVVNIPYSSVAIDSTHTGRQWSAPDMTGKKGWKMVFTGGERVLSNPILPADTASVVFATTKPSGDVCDSGNSGYIMGGGLGTGSTNRLKVNGILVGGLAINSYGTNKVSPTFANLKGEQRIVCNQDDCKPEECTVDCWECIDNANCPAPGCTDAHHPAEYCMRKDTGPITIPNSSPKGRYSWREILSK